MLLLRIAANDGIIDSTKAPLSAWCPQWMSFAMLPPRTRGSVRCCPEPQSTSTAQARLENHQIIVDGPWYSSSLVPAL